MKKRIIAILLAVVLLMTLSAAVVAAKTEVKNIHVEISDKLRDYFNTSQHYPANVGLDGSFRDKDGNMYMSPWNGTINITWSSSDIQEYQLHVKALKESEPGFRHVIIETNPPYREHTFYYFPAEFTIGSDKGFGEVVYTSTYSPTPQTTRYRLTFHIIRVFVNNKMLKEGWFAKNLD